MPLYFNALRLAKTKGDYEQSNGLLESIEGFQRKFGKQVLPSAKRIDAEITYNKYDIFKKLFSWYLYAGMLLFVVLLVQIFKNNKALKFLIVFLKYIILFLFILHTGGLIARLFISGHARWSDA